MNKLIAKILFCPEFTKSARFGKVQIVKNFECAYDFYSSHAELLEISILLYPWLQICKFTEDRISAIFRCKNNLFDYYKIEDC